MRRGFALFDPATGAAPRYLHQPEPDQPGNRFNDGRCDAAGRFWAGSMDFACQDPTGALYRYDPDGTCTLHDEGFAVTNGPAWPGGQEGGMFFNDTVQGRTYRYDFDAASGRLSNRTLWKRWSPEEGVPDGMTADAEGRLWIAHWGGSCVTCHDPATAQELARIDLPVSQVTHCAFGGPRPAHAVHHLCAGGADARAAAGAATGGRAVRRATGRGGPARQPLRRSRRLMEGGRACLPHPFFRRPCCLSSPLFRSSALLFIASITRSHHGRFFPSRRLLHHAGQHLGLVPTLGGSVAAWQIDDPQGPDSRLDLWRPWDGVTPDLYRMASFAMVPWSNRISGGGFSHAGQFHSMQPNRAGEPYPIHGDGWLQPWSLHQTAKTPWKCAWSPCASAAAPMNTPACRPSGWSRAGWTQSVVVNPPGAQPLPYGLGLHPWFPRTSGTRISAPVRGVWLSGSDPRCPPS